jgi:hypothetical protein
MSSSEKEALESQIQSLMEGKGLEKEETESSSKSKKPYVWTEKRKAAFDKMRDGLAMKVEVTKQMKKEKRDLEKKDIKARIQKIMNPSSQKSTSKKERMESSEEDKSESSASEEEEEVRPSKHSKRSAPAAAPKDRMTATSSSHSKGKRRAEKEVVKESESEESESEEESYEIASAKQKQHYRDSKLKIGKAQRSTNALNALDNYILL